MSDIEALAGKSNIAVGLGTALPKPRTHHPYVVGLVFIGIGLFTLVGSITGTLPSMLAALFVPQALEDVHGGSASPSVFGIVTGLGSTTNNPNGTQTQSGLSGVFHGLGLPF